MNFGSNTYMYLLKNELIKYRNNLKNLSLVIQHYYNTIIENLHASYWNCSDIESNNNNDLLNHINKQKFMKYIKFGDIVHIEQTSKYFIYNGSTFIQLINHIIPHSIFINDFPSTKYFTQIPYAITKFWLRSSTIPPKFIKHLKTFDEYITSDGFIIFTDIENFERVYFQKCMLCMNADNNSHNKIIISSTDEKYFI